MEYNGYKLLIKKNALIIKNIKNFIPKHVFECGQCFRWLKQEDSSYTGVVSNKIINISYKDNDLIIKNSNLEDFLNIWFDYFDLGTDYSYIISKISKDKIMEEAIKFGFGIRILKQDFWETLISFIISANNRIPRIMKTVQSLSEIYGEKLYAFGKNFYSFPSSDKFKALNISDIEFCKAGFRCKYILNTATDINNSLVDLQYIKTVSSDLARVELMKLLGVGNKVADCVLLYSGLKRDVFPTDVWVKRVMEELYFKKDTSFKEIQEFSKSYFGEFAGIAQQYLFYYARENKIGAKN